MQRLETARLVLRPWREEDREDLFEYAKDPRVGPIAGWPCHRDSNESLEIIRTVFAAENVTAMVLKETGKVLGSVGFTGDHRGELPGPDDEIGYCLNPAFWGRGLMPEAVREIIRFGFEGMGLNTIWCNHYDGNDKSRRVIEKCGFIHRFSANAAVPLMGETRMCHYYAMTREEWKP